jgi:peptide/nickel transport system substrate-binding protein
VKGADGLALPYLDEVIFKDMNDDNVKTTNLLSGTVDGVDYNSSINSLKTLQAAKNLTTLERPYITTYMVTFNLKDPQLKDARVRQAVSYAINQKEIITSVFDGYAVETNFVGVGKASPFYSDYAPYSYNPEKAKALLAEAGYPNGITIKINSITREPDNTIVQVLQQQFKASNITLNVEPLERLAWIDVIRTKFSGEMGLCISDVPGYDLTTVYNQTLINSAPDSIASYLPLLDKTKTATTVDGRKTAFGAFQKQILDDAVVAVLCQKGQYATYSSKVHGFKFFATCTGDYSQVWKEK